MNRITALVTTLIFAFVGLHAQNWDYICTSGTYYWGEGTADSEAEADRMALENLVSQISTHVSSDMTIFTGLRSSNGRIEQTESVLHCLQTYSMNTLTNVTKWVFKNRSPYVVRRFMRRTELESIFQGRIAKSREYMQIASNSLSNGSIDMALQYYYWAYSLICSLQRPNDVLDEDGAMLMTKIPNIIESILSDITIQYISTDGDDTTLGFYYRGEPVNSLVFNYNDGVSQITGCTARNGRGRLEMDPHAIMADVYHVEVEYKFKSQSRSEPDMEAVLRIVPDRPFRHANFAVDKVAPTPEEQTPADADLAAASEEAATPDTDSKELEGAAAENPAAPVKVLDSEFAAEAQPQNSPEAPEDARQGNELSAMECQEQANILRAVIDNIRERRYSDCYSYLTDYGRNVFDSIVGYGSGRVLDDSKLRFYRGSAGRIVARGVDMSFSFRRGTKTTFVETMTFTFDDKNLIENIAFGMGRQCEDDLLHKIRPSWSTEAREALLEFLENYKTAYCLKRSDYLSALFAEDAHIIVGTVLRRASGVRRGDYEDSFSMEGRDRVVYNNYDKATYMQHLNECFRRNQFINLRFSDIDTQRLSKFRNDDLYAVQLSQEYNSSYYADKGYLFLLIDMKDSDEPLITIRTWQPNHVPIEERYNAGDFFND